VRKVRGDEVEGVDWGSPFDNVPGSYFPLAFMFRGAYDEFLLSLWACKFSTVSPFFCHCVGILPLN